MAIRGWHRPSGVGVSPGGARPNCNASKSLAVLRRVVPIMRQGHLCRPVVRRAGQSLTNVCARGTLRLGRTSLCCRDFVVVDHLELLLSGGTEVPRGGHSLHGVAPRIPDGGGRSRETRRPPWRSFVLLQSTSQAAPGSAWTLRHGSPFTVVQMPAKANSGPSSLSANHTRS